MRRNNLYKRRPKAAFGDAQSSTTSVVSQNPESLHIFELLAKQPEANAFERHFFARLESPVGGGHGQQFRLKIPARKGVHTKIYLPGLTATLVAGLIIISSKTFVLSNKSQRFRER